MIGAIVVALVVLVVLPVSFMMMGGAVSAVFGWLLKDNNDADHEGSELLDTNY